MQPTALRIMHDEHRALEAMLHSVRMLLDDCRRHDKQPPFDVLRAMLFYLDEFPERRHHRKESELLFPLLRQRCGDAAAAALDRLDRDHAASEQAIRELEHALLAYEMLGAARRDVFETALERYVQAYLEHVRLEEREILPLAQRTLTAQDWQALDEAFGENRDPLLGHAPEDAYAGLFRRIVTIAPAPIGLG